MIKAMLYPGMLPCVCPYLLLGATSSLHLSGTGHCEVCEITWRSQCRDRVSSHECRACALCTRASVCGELDAF